MDIRNCVRCGRIFRKVSLPFCPACVKLDQEEFERVRRYLKEHPNATVVEVSEETDVPVNRIYGWVREGRLTTGSGGDWSVECEVCGTQISSGRLCDACREKVLATAKKSNPLGEHRPFRPPDPREKGKRTPTTDRFRRR